MSAIVSLFADVNSAGKVHALGGLTNVSLSARAGSGDIVVRVCNDGYTSDDHLRLEVSVLRYLQSVGFLLSPRIVPGLDGRDIQRWNGHRIIAMSRLPGEPADQVDITQVICRDVGHAVAVLGRKLSGYKFPRLQSISYWVRSGRLLDIPALMAVPSSWGIDRGMMVKLWNWASGLISDTLPEGTIIHSDIWPPNVLVADGRVSGIVDFDDIAVGPAVIDLASALSEFAIEGVLEINEERFRAILDGFRAGSGGVLGFPVELLVPAFITCYVPWLACGMAADLSATSGAAVYAKRLMALQDDATRVRLDRRIRHLVG